MQNKEGSLYKKSKRLPSWTEYLFVLNHNHMTITFYLKYGDQQSSGSLVLRSDCYVSVVEKKLRNKPQYAFCVTWPKTCDYSVQSWKTADEPKNANGTTLQYNAEYVLRIGSDSLEDTEEWKLAFEEAIKMCSKKEVKMVKPKPLGESAFLLKAMERSAVLFNGKWKVAALFGGVQVWQELPKVAKYEKQANRILKSASSFTVLVLAFAIGGASICQICACLIVALGMAVLGLVFVTDSKNNISSFKITKIIHASAADVFACIMSNKNRPSWDSAVKNIRVVQTIDDNSEIIHVQLNSVWLWPMWLTPRDLCLLRYWRQEEDGSYVICMQSVTHPECKPSQNYIRAICRGGGVTIATRNSTTSAHDDAHALVTQVSHMEMQGLAQSVIVCFDLVFQYMKPQIMSIVGLRDTVEACKYASVNFIDQTTTLPYGNHLVDQSSSNSNASAPNSLSSVVQKLPCTLDEHMWCQPEPGTMLVRGPDYVSDRRKIPSISPAFSLVAVDAFETEGPYEHIAAHPENLIQKELSKYAKESSKMPFTFVVHFIVPGSKHLSIVLYYRANDPAVLEEHTPFAELMNTFLTNENDSFRDERFKLIPCIVEGPFIVRQAVGSTPALIGKKLRQPYFRGEQYFEVDIDICSSMVANRVTGLVLGYTKKLVIDLGFVIEGQTPDELPERLFGSVRLKHVDLDKAKKLSPAT